MSRQTMIALPPWALIRLNAKVGDGVWLHRHRPGEVVLSRVRQLGPGRLGRGDLERELQKVMAERDQWKRQALESERGDYRQGYAHGYGAALKHMGPVSDKLDVVIELVRVLQLRTPAARRAARRLVRLTASLPSRTMPALTSVPPASS